MTKTVNPTKAVVVSTLSDLLKQAKSVAVVDYKGLKVSQATELRKAIKAAGGLYLVAKNTLFKIALQNTNHELPALEGTSGFVFSIGDEVAALKAVADFAKKNSIPSFKLGLLGDRVLSADEIAHLASLPNRTTLLSHLATRLNTPLYSLAYSLNWNISKLVRTLDAIRISKSN